jgi:hypothetical protein
VLQFAAAAALPIVVAMLVLGGVAKLAAGDSAPGALARLGPAVLVPERFARPAMICCAAGEFALAAALVFADHPAARWLPVVFFSIATYVLWDLRKRRPDAGCGCFGDVSVAPVGLRSIARSAVLTAMAVLVALERVTGADLPALWSGTVAAWIAGYAALLLLLSPEVEELIDRVRYRAPCEQRRIPPGRALSRLKASAAWRAHRPMLAAEEPSDMWRELCWRFFTFPAKDGSEVVFAVYLSGRRPAVKAAVVPPDGAPAIADDSRVPISR